MCKHLLLWTVTCLFTLGWSKSIDLEDESGYCSIEGILIKEGTNSPSPLGSCRIIYCEKANPVSASATPCARFMPRPGCSVGNHDYTKLYPDCCPTEVC